MANKHPILIIDDDLDYADSQQEFLQDNGYIALVANDTETAKFILENEPVEIALVDIRLGSGNGVSMLESLKKGRPDLVCIMVTAYASISTAVEAIKHGAYEYLTKPINPESLLATIERASDVIKLYDERDSARSALVKEQERAQVTLEAIGDGVITTDAYGRIEYMNPAAENILGWHIMSAKGLAIEKVIKLYHEKTEKTVDNPVYKCIRENIMLNSPMAAKLVLQGTNSIYIEHSASPIHDHKDKIIGAVLVIRDVTESRQLNEKIAYQARHDALTGLINRLAFEFRLEESLLQARRDDKVQYLLYIDLDQFKVVNDTCGHVAGDELLCQLTAMFKEKLDDSVIIARLGGDEFGILIENRSNVDANRIAESILEICREFRFSWQDKTFTIGASIGMVIIDKETTNISDVLSHADTACYTAKDAGRNRIHKFEPGDEDSLKRHNEMQWVAKINKAIDENRFCLFYQHIVPVNSNDRKNTHCELLIRMKDEDGRLIPPGAFIPAAERYNLMATIDRWVVSTLFELYEKRNRTLMDVSLCTVNLSGQTLSDERFVDFISALLERKTIAPEKICFEITETAAISNLKNAMHLISELRLRGCQFALDDFGSGLSSFAYLKNLPVDYLKIDGYFIKDMVDDPIDYAMVKSINDVGHVMGKKIIAEFVENDAIIQKLKEIGVDYLQGYGIALPEPLSD